MCFELHGPAAIWEHQKRKVVTKTFLYKIYREILFQKVALGYLLHFVQNGSSQKRTKNMFFAHKCKQIKKQLENALYISP